MTTESLSVTIEGEVLTVEIGTVAVAPGGGSGDVVGPASATDDRIAAFDGVTGKLIKQGSVTATAVASHLGSTSNPHSVTAAQVGADATGTAAAAVVAHVAATDPHGDRSFATSAVSTHAALTTGAHGLGGASQLNVGTTAGTVAAGDHAHAGVYQPLATVLTNTTAAFTSAQETKLSGIEALADVTDAGNVGAAIDGATAKTTPVDADTFALIDSAASNILKKLSWANIKATAKAYFDTLYQAVLVSGTNIKTINSTSLLGSGDIAVSASPGGSTTQVQVNDAGSFGGDAGFTYNNITKSLTVGIGSGANQGWILGTFSSGASGLWNSGVTPDTSNFALVQTSNTTYLRGGGTLYFRGGDEDSVAITAVSGTNALKVAAGTTIGWTSGSASDSVDLALRRDAANTIAQRNGATAQEDRLYRSYTDGSNYSRLSRRFYTTTALIHAEGAGTGSDGSVAFNDAALATNATVGFLMIPSCAGAPSGTPADIPTGQIPMVWDSTNLKLYVYTGGAWKSSAAFT